MQTSGILFLPADNVKPMKRGRVPKGFLSSNTAYMLVYKRLTTDCRANAAKKMKSKKLDETNASGDAVHMQKIIKDIKSDTLDETKRKNEVEVLSIQEECSENISKLDLETKLESDEIATFQKTDTPVVGKNGITELTIDTNESSNNNEHDSTSQPNKIQSLKQPIVKVMKLDYKRLNGAAHRAMSCGEQDFYEEVTYRYHMLLNF